MTPASIFISAGEVSGDMHAAAVIDELIKRHPGTNISGIAGSRMLAAGCHPLHPMQALNVMGISDVIPALPRIHRIEKSILRWCEENKPAAAILVDFSSFHMRLGRKLRTMGIPVLHFIAPKLWAWGSWRIRKLKQSQNALACILPFEPDWFGKHGIAASYVGNPSVIACAGGWSRDALKARLGVEQSSKLLAILPGSRSQEIKSHVTVLAEVMRQIRQIDASIEFVVPVAPGVSRESLAALWQAGGLPLERQEADYALRADASIAVSGTATLELALWDVPTVLIYKTSVLTMFLARKLVGVKCAGLANIILDDRTVMPELIQQDCTAEHIVEHVLPMLQNTDEGDRQRAEFKELRRRLGTLSPAHGVVDMIDALLMGVEEV
jgi:lipid-A-disaccharide synthase